MPGVCRTRSLVCKGRKHTSSHHRYAETGAAGAVRRKSFLGERIKLACLRVALDRGVELLRVEYFVPRAKPRQFLRGSCSMAFSISSAVVMPRK